MTPLLLLLAVSLAHATATNLAATCTGASAALPPAECTAWQAFYDATGGEDWTLCHGNRFTPCDCDAGADIKHALNPPTGVTCIGGHITGM